VVAALLSSGAVMAAAPVQSDPLEPARAAIRIKEFGAARALLQRLAASGSADAQYLLGCMELAGLTGPPDPAAARQWLEQAAAQAHARAAWSLATLLAIRDPSDAAATRWLDEAVRLGVPAARDTVAREALPLQFRPALDLPDAQSRAEALWHAVAAGDLKELAALASPPQLAMRDSFGRDALARAAAAGNAAALRLLLARGASIDMRDSAGTTPLMLASRAGSAAALEVLLPAGARGLDAADHAGNTALMYAAGSGNLDAVERLLAAGASVAPRNAQDWSALDFARTAGEQPGQAAIAARLEKEGAQALAHQGLAAAMPTSVRRSAGADGYAGWPDIAVAATRTDPALLAALIGRGADVNATVPGGVPVLQVAVRARSPRAVEALLVAGADVARTDGHGDSALTLAARSADEPILRLLLAHGARDDSGAALLAAVQGGRQGAVQVLLAARARPDAADRQGRTALMFAASQADGGMARALLEAGAAVNSADGQGRTASWYAAQAGKAATLALLAQRGAALDRADRTGLVPLAAAAAAGQLDAVKFLLGASAAVDARNPLRETALHLAAAGGHAQVVAQLLAAGADHDAQDALGDTPLMMAARSGSADTVSLLLDAGASRRLRNRERATAADIAEARSFTQIARMLKGTQ
jgi:ankyrin repeat protein